MGVFQSNILIIILTADYIKPFAFGVWIFSYKVYHFVLQLIQTPFDLMASRKVLNDELIMYICVNDLLAIS